jgi:hypothetical protein
MRIWDIEPGYLNRQSLLGEHRELHGIVSIISNNKKGYSRHPETLRWADYGWALRQRHQLLLSEMTLRGFNHYSPVRMRSNEGVWPKGFIDPPGEQFAILRRKYANAEQGRIVLPVCVQQLWSQHKYSVLARDEALYKEIGRRVSGNKSNADFQALANELVEMLRVVPGRGGVRNALHHMWGYVSNLYKGDAKTIESWSSGRLLQEIRKLALLGRVEYVLSSTALGELGVWV